MYATQGFADYDNGRTGCFLPFTIEKRLHYLFIMYVCMYVCIDVCKNVCMYGVFLFVCKFVRMYVCMYVCLYVYYNNLHQPPGDVDPVNVATYTVEMPSGLCHYY